VRILTLALGIPFPPLGGGLIRTFHLLKSLAAHHQVTLAAFTYGESHDVPPYPIQLEAVPWEWSVAYREMTGPDADASRRAYERLTYDDPEPWFVSVMDPAAMEQTLARLLREPPDLVLLEGTPLARFMPVLPAGVPCVLDLFDIHSEMARRARDSADAVERRAATREAERTLAFERDAVSRCAACLAVSEQDAAAARTLLGATAVQVVPNGVDTSYYTPSREPPEPGTVLFTGRMSYAPNADAAIFFANEVLPLVQRDCPEARFHIVGAAPPPQVCALKSPSVVVHGRVDDVRPHFRNAEVVVVPVRAGGGTRLKVLEAAASAKAVVSTSLGVEGLAFEDGRDILVADSAAAFAAATLTLLRDPATRHVLGTGARAAAMRYDWSAIGERFLTGLASLFPAR
jgi:glycosyltransferase involved in cell wall biosynthesis